MLKTLLVLLNSGWSSFDPLIPRLVTRLKGDDNGFAENLNLDFQSLTLNSPALASDIGFFEDIGNDHVRDVFGVEWDRSVDKDIGIVSQLMLPEPTLKGYTFPDPLDKRFFENIPSLIAAHPERFRLFRLGFSLFERAWTLRGMENLMLAFIEEAV